MAIYLGGETAATKPNLDDLTPRQIVAELDKYVVGQNAAKKAVAVALRNRIRRQKLPPEMAEDVLPKNTQIQGFEVDAEFPDIGRHFMRLDARRIDRSDGRPALILLVMEDVIPR